MLRITLEKYADLTLDNKINQQYNKFFSRKKKQKSIHSNVFLPLYTLLGYFVKTNLVHKYIYFLNFTTHYNIQIS